MQNYIHYNNEKNVYNKPWQTNEPHYTPFAYSSRSLNKMAEIV